MWSKNGFSVFNHDKNGSSNEWKLAIGYVTKLILTIKDYWQLSRYSYAASMSFGQL